MVAVAFGTVLELGEFPIGGALSAARHPATLRQFQVDFRNAKGRLVVAAALVYGGKRRVRVTTDEAFSNALLVEAYGAFGIAALFGFSGSLVTLEGGVETTQGVFLSTDPGPLIVVEGGETGRIPCTFITSAEDTAQLSEHYPPPFPRRDSKL